MTIVPALPHPTDLPTHPTNSTGDLPDPALVAGQWLETFAQAAKNADGEQFRDLFVDNGYWRDILAFTNDYRSIRTVNIANAAKAVFPSAQARDFALGPHPPAYEHPYPDVMFLTIHLTFSTKIGKCFGLTRLVLDGESWKSFTVFTLLEEIIDHPRRIAALRPRGAHNERVSYDEKRAQEAGFDDRHPDVLIVGGGHNGLATAAQLKSMGIESLVVDTFKRVGDNWRLRYRSLSLHDPVNANHLPFIPFPATWPAYTPAGKLANFLEAYVEMLEINVWTETTLDPSQTSFDPKTKMWNVSLLRKVEGQTKRVDFQVSHIVLATGLGGGQPKMPPPFPGQDEWDAKAVHSSRHTTGADWKGKKALVVGACTSGHDIALDFAQNGVDVTMLQRTPTFVMSVDKGQGMMVAPLYNDNMVSVDHQDRLGESNPKFVVKLHHKRIVKNLQKADRELLDGLTEKGFKHWSGPEGSGFIMMALEKAGGYYYSTGGSEAIIRGEIKVRQGEIAAFEQGSQVVFKDGSKERFDVVVFATGYTGFPDTVKATLGSQYSTIFSPVWGLDAEGEIRGVARESNIPNTFFAVGALAGSRMTSKIIALQILAQRLGIFGERYTWERQKAEGGLVDETVYRAYEGLAQHPMPVKDYE